MTNIERMAKEAGALVEQWLTLHPKTSLYHFTPESLDKFAALVADDMAQLCDDRACKLEKHMGQKMVESARAFCGGVVSASRRNAAAIRAKYPMPAQSDGKDAAR